MHVSSSLTKIERLVKVIAMICKVVVRLCYSVWNQSVVLSVLDRCVSAVSLFFQCHDQMVHFASVQFV